MEQMKVAVFIASHIHYEGQIDLLNKALQSVWSQSSPYTSQTIVPHIHVSMSLDPSFLDEDHSLKKKWEHLEMLTWDIYTKQMFQMQHLEHLTDSYAQQYDTILFLDDDDEYDTHRVAVLSRALTVGLNHFGPSKKICVRETTNDDEHQDMPEYWAYGVQPVILQDFFKEIRERRLLVYIWNKMGDMVLRSYLRFKDIQVVGIPHQLYIYNKSNPFGVCNSQHFDFHIEYDPKTFKRHQLQQITNLASYATNETGIYSIEELFKRVQKTVLGPHKESFYPPLFTACLSAQKLIDYYNELRAFARE